MSQEVLTPIKFHFYSLVFTPYNELVGQENTTTILNKIITYITNERRSERGHLINKNQKRPTEEPRELFMTSSVFMPREQRIRCSIALLRSGRKPKIKPTDKFALLPIKDIGTIAEETHFYIDYSKDHAVICVEFNSHGPRMSDIEYYFRNVSRDTLKLSKNTDVHLYMDDTLDNAIKNLKNVLNFDIKLQPKKLAKLDTVLVGKYFTGLNSFGNIVKPNFLKIEALFQTPGKNVESKELNKDANNMIVDLFNSFKKNPINTECFENFVVKYEDKDGNEDIFNLLKGKKEITKEINFKSIQKKREYYELIEQDFNEFMEQFN